MAAYDKMHMPTHTPKVFIQAWRKHTNGKKEKLGADVNKKIGTQNITRRKKKNVRIHIIRKEKQRWWYINRGIRSPTKIKP